MKIRPFKPLVQAGLAGVALFVVFPNVLGPTLWPLAWVALVPLVYALDSAWSARRAAVIAGAAGVCGYPFLYHWLVYCMHTYANMSYPVCFAVLALLVLTLSLYLMGFGACYHVLTKRLGLSPLIAAPVAWTSFELLRGHFPVGGFPWALMAYSQAEFPPIIQIAEVTGPYGVTFLIVLANAALAMALKGIMAPNTISEEGQVTLDSNDSNPRDAVARVTPPASSNSIAAKKLTLKYIALAIAAPLFALTYGLIRMPLVDRAFASQPEITVGVVQANIDQGLKWDRDFFWQSLQDHMDLTSALMKDKPRLVIWPEAAVTAPGGFNHNWDRRSRVIHFLAQINNAYLLTGAMSWEQCSPESEDRCAHNSVYLLSPGAQNVAGRYDKTHLVPFGEYVPLAWLLFFVDNIAQGNTGSTTAGSGVKVLGMPGAYFGCVICYEVIFPELVRKFRKEGAEFMTTVTNDAWFGKTGAPYQHHANVVFRSVENRVYFVRSANTGISSIVDPNGRIIHQTGLYVPASFTGKIKASPIKTFYAKWGDVFARANAAAMIVAIVMAVIRARIERKTSQ